MLHSVEKEENEPEMSLLVSMAKTTAAEFQLVMHGWDDELLSQSFSSLSFSLGHSL